MKVRIFATRVSSSGDGVKIPARIIPAPLPQRHKITACRPNCGNGTIIPQAHLNLALGTRDGPNAVRDAESESCQLAERYVLLCRDQSGPAEHRRRRWSVLCGG